MYVCIFFHGLHPFCHPNGERKAHCFTNVPNLRNTTCDNEIFSNFVDQKIVFSHIFTNGVGFHIEVPHHKIKKYLGGIGLKCPCPL